MKTIVFSNKGKRDVNQDFILGQHINPETSLHLIADGMGGYEHGEIAAKMVAENVLTFLSTVEIINETQIQKAINKANLAIRQFREKTNSKIGATVGGIILQANQATCFWVGDVKILLFKNKQLIRESKPHNMMNEVIKNGSIKDLSQINKYRHVVTRSVQGDVDHSQIEFFRLDNLDDTDIIIICSDGVHDIYDGTQLQHILTTSGSIELAFQEIQERLLLESKDNFSLVGIEIKNMQ